MLNLNGILNSHDIDTVRNLTNIRFLKPESFNTPEALILYEQGIMDESEIVDICSKHYNIELKCPVESYISDKILEQYEPYKCVPIYYSSVERTMTVGVLPEYSDVVILSRDDMLIKKVLVPIHYYVRLRSKYYREPEFLADVPIYDKWESIVNEALSLDASEITISNIASGARIYYNVRKRYVPSRRSLAKDDVHELGTFLSSKAGYTITEDSRDPRYFSIDMDINHRCRVVVNRVYYGFSITLRIFSNEVMSTTMEDLNLSPTTIEFMRRVVLSKEKGLRLFIGETFSGKNVSILSALRELVCTSKFKIISVEQPVETLVDGMEQIDCETDDEYSKNSDSLLRQNPDIVYFTEITNRTAPNVMKQSNTSKAVFSAIHANSISDVLARLQDITEMPLDRLILTLQSCVYQELVRDEEKDMLFPVTRCIHFDRDLKEKLYGKSMAEITNILWKLESNWV